MNNIKSVTIVGVNCVVKKVTKLKVNIYDVALSAVWWMHESSFYPFVSVNCIVTRKYVNVVPTNCNFKVF